MNTQLPDVIDALRPQGDSIDPEWSQETLRLILATTPAPARPELRRRRIRKVLVGTGALAVLGGGVAAAADIMPQSFTDAFAGWSLTGHQYDDDPGRQSVDPATARRLATEPGPGGTIFSLVAANGTGRYACVAALFETPSSAGKPAPDAFVDANGSSCDAQPAHAGFGDGAAVDVLREPDTLGEPAVVVYSVATGDAVRAVLQTADGQSYPVLRLNGRFYGWYPGHGSPPGGVLIGYAANGEELGRFSDL